MKKDLRFNREAWLRAAYALLRKRLLPRAPERVAISWSFPSKGGTTASRRRIGECHYTEGTVNGRIEGRRVVLISPTLRKPYDLLECLVHEMVHTVTGPEAGHRAPFSQLSASIGLVKPWTATTAGKELRKKLMGYLKVLPKWPGGFLTIQTRQKNRQLKAVCACEPARILRAVQGDLRGRVDPLRRLRGGIPTRRVNGPFSGPAARGLSWAARVDRPRDREEGGDNEWYVGTVGIVQYDTRPGERSDLAA